MAKYQAYPVYKDSGIDWLGKIPSNWSISKIKYIAELNPSKQELKNNLNDICSFVPMEKLKLDTLVLDERRVVSEVIDGYTYFKNGDILLAKVTPCFENKNMAIASDLINGIGLGSSEIYALRSFKDENQRFLYYCLQEIGFIELATGAMTGAGGLKRVPAEFITNFMLTRPPVEEQVNIVNFLEHETAKIDQLIEKQQQLIELLQEKRQAVISHAVIKGLGFNIRMKDSGVEWLDRVPEHWSVVSIKYLTQFVLTGGTPKNEVSFTESEELNWFTPGDFKESVEIQKSSKYITHNSVKTGDSKLYPEGSVLMIGIGATLGKIAISRKEFSCNQQINVLVPNDLVEAKYLAFSLIAQNEQIKQLANASTIGILNQEKTKQLIIAVPDLNEQKEIVEYLNSETAKIDTLIQKAESAITLIQERRTALISAAVTGKIDVRNWQAPVTSEVTE